jgi:hypothetical protein
MTRVETRRSNRLWDYDEASVTDVLGEMYLRAAKEGKLRRISDRLSEPAEQVLFAAWVGAKADALVLFSDADIQIAVDRGVHWDSSSEKSSEDELDADVCVDLTYRTINAYLTLPPPRAISRIAKLQQRMYQALSYASGLFQQLSHQVEAAQPMLPAASPEWIEECIRFELQGERERSLDVLFDTIDEMLLASQFTECDRCISSMPVERLANAQLLTILTATAGAKEHLPSRRGFYRKTRELFAFRGADVDALLVGLE